MKDDVELFIRSLVSSLEALEIKSKLTVVNLPMMKGWVDFGVKVKVKSSLILCDPMDYSLQCSSVHGIFQARVLEWVAISFSRGSSQPRDRTWVSRIVGRCFTI